MWTARSALFAPLVALALAAAAGAQPPLPWVEGSQTLVVMPDTQYYTVEKMSSGASFRDRFAAQTTWIAQRRAERGIAYAFHLGDITQDNLPDQWAVARAAFDHLEGVVPYAILPGNHDYSGDRAPTQLTRHFPVDQAAAQPTFGGVFEEGKLDNSFHLFEMHGLPWVVVALECWPRRAALQWADAVFARHRDRLGILITHAYLDGHDQRIALGEDRLQDNALWQCDGADMWDMARRHPRLMLVIAGHVAEDGLGYRADDADHGNLVHQMLVNFQARPHGGNAYLRLLEFLPDRRTVQVRCYSPYARAYKTDAQNQFTFTLRPARGDDAALTPPADRR